MSQFSPQPSRLSANAKLSTLRRLRRLSHLLDNAIGIPGTPIRFGLDPLLGLVPGIGDFLGTAFSIYIVLEAARWGVPRPVLVKMVSNILVDTVSGIVPVLGDLADVTWKANVKNIALLEQHLELPPQQRQSTNWWFITLLVAGLLLVVMAVTAIGFMILRWLLGAISNL
ncbi:MAG: DUF4112 domain-containing protein [Cyanobacteriota bacterium]